MKFRLLPLRYSELVYQVTMYCVLHVTSSGIIPKHLHACLVIFLKIEMAIHKDNECVCVKFCFLLGRTTAQTGTILKEAFKDEAMGTTRVYKWFSHCERGEMSVEDPPHCGLPSTRTHKKG